MSDETTMNDVATDVPTKRGPGRPKGPRSASRQRGDRRNYQADLAALQGRVETALRLLRAADGSASASKELIAVAIETLEE